MFESIIQFFKKLGKSKPETNNASKDTAKERLHLVLMQDRANVSADFLDLMKQEIIEVIKKYIDVDENAIDVRLANKTNTDGTTGAPALYANIPIVSIKNEEKHINGKAIEKNNQEIVEKNKKENKQPEQEEKVKVKDDLPKQEEVKEGEQSTDINMMPVEEKTEKEENSNKQEEKNSESVKAITSANSDKKEG